MRIIGEIEGVAVHPLLGRVIQRVKVERPQGEIAIIEYTQSEIEVLHVDFESQRVNNRWHHESQQQLEKAEIMHMIGVAIKNYKKASVTWFRDKAEAIESDALEFDKNSYKMLLRIDKRVYVIVSYWGRWVGGDKQDGPEVIRDNPDGSLDSDGEEIL